MAEYFTERQLRYKRREALQEEIERLQKEKAEYDKEEQMKLIQRQRQMLLLQREKETSIRRMHTSNDDREESSYYPDEVEYSEMEEVQNEQDPRNGSFCTLDETGYFDQESPRKSPVCETQIENDAESSLDLSAEIDALDLRLTELHEENAERGEEMDVVGNDNNSNRNRTPIKRVTINTDPCEKLHHRQTSRRQMVQTERREYHTNTKDKEITTPARRYHYRITPEEETIVSVKGTDRVKYEDTSANPDGISDSEILEYQNSIRQIEVERRRLDQLKAEHEKQIQQMIEKNNQLSLQKERKRKEEEMLLRSIQLLELKEKEVDEKVKESEKLKSLFDESVAEELAMDKRIKILKLKENETIKRIAQKESKKTDKPVTDKTEHKVETLTIEKALLGKPYLPAFEGKNYEDWKMEVSCLIKSKMYQEKVLAQAIRNSLKGQTRKILLSMNPTASTSELMEKLEEVYGSLKESDTLLQDFFSAWQNPTESSSDWGIRIENLFQRVVEKGDVDELNRNDMLKRKFWKGLQSEKLKEALRVSFESKDTFEMLRKKARREEEEIETRKKKDNTTVPEYTEGVKSTIQQPVRTNTETDAKLDKLLDRMKELEDQMKTMKVQKQYGPPNFLQNRTPNRYMSNRRPRGRFGYRNQGVRGQRGIGRGNDHSKQSQAKDESEQNQKAEQNKKQSLNQ
ncbi:trichohyalin-like [Mercenaria mercenaria]|uniref:trichohyalin-like n=1 Tax=Mercenaria mercenaria TaxID=6596 RepID=UPI00234F471C|nr:trichohyalin-like [Mercenaria mercenaria]